jgi:hypothetical protein
MAEYAELFRRQLGRFSLVMCSVALISAEEGVEAAQEVHMRLRNALMRRKPPTVGPISGIAAQRRRTTHSQEDVKAVVVERIEKGKVVVPGKEVDAASQSRPRPDEKVEHLS